MGDVTMLDEAEVIDVEVETADHSACDDPDDDTDMGESVMVIGCNEL
jgi:hypothetical protein